MSVLLRAIAALSALAFGAGAVAQTKVTLAISTGPTTGVYYPLGGGIANLLTKYVPGYAANAESTAGSVANLQLMAQKNSDVAVSGPPRAIETMPTTCLSPVTLVRSSGIAGKRSDARSGLMPP